MKARGGFLSLWRWAAVASVAALIVLASTGVASAAAISYVPGDYTAGVKVTEGGATYLGTEYRDTTKERARRDLTYPEGDIVSTFAFLQKNRGYTYDSFSNACGMGSIPAGGSAAEVSDGEWAPITDFVQEGTIESEGQTLERWVGSSAEGPVVVGLGPPPGNPAGSSTPVLVEAAGQAVRLQEPFAAGEPDAAVYNLPAACVGVGPSTTVTTPGPLAVYQQGQVVDAQFSCAGNEEPLLPGAEGCLGTVADGAPIDTSTLGEHTFTVVASETGGETWTATRHYTVVAAPPPAPSGGGQAPPATPIVTPSAPAAVRLIYTPNHAHKPNPAGGPRWTFHFSGDPGVSFSCKLDKGAFKPCTSPQVYRHLSLGPHVFAVKAIGASGLESPVSEVKFSAGKRHR